MILRVDFLIKTPDELERLVSVAIRRGYLRVNPAKGWTAPEKRDAARWAAEQLVYDHTEADK